GTAAQGRTEGPGGGGFAWAGPVAFGPGILRWCAVDLTRVLPGGRGARRSGGTKPQRTPADRGGRGRFRGFRPRLEVCSAPGRPGRQGQRDGGAQLAGEVALRPDLHGPGRMDSPQRPDGPSFTGNVPQDARSDRGSTDRAGEGDSGTHRRRPGGCLGRGRRVRGPDRGRFPWAGQRTWPAVGLGEPRGAARDKRPGGGAAAQHHAVTLSTGGSSAPVCGRDRTSLSIPRGRPHTLNTIPS